MRVAVFAFACLALFIVWPFLTGSAVEGLFATSPFATQLLISKLGLAIAMAGLIAVTGVWRQIGFVTPRGLRGCLYSLPLWAFIALMYATGGGFGSDSAATWILVFVPLAITTSFTEEVLARGGLWAALRPLGAWPMVLGSSVIFGAVHLMGLMSELPAVLIYAQAFMAFAIGLVLAAVRISSGSIWLVILIHSVFNWLSFAINGFGATTGPMNEGTSPEQIAMGLVVISALLAIWGLASCWLALRGERNRDLLPEPGAEMA